MRKQEIENEKYFATKSLAVSAALLTSGGIKIAGIKTDPFDNKKEFFLEPLDLCKERHDLFYTGELMVDANLNAQWITKLKNRIFDERRGLEEQ